MNLYKSIYGVSTTTVVKSGAGFLHGIIIVTAGAAGGVYDTAITSGVSALGPLITAIPAATGVPVVFGDVGWPCQSGITVVPGSGQVVNIAYQ